MQLTNAILSSLLATLAAARPKATSEADEPLPQKSRITAFLINEEGEPSVECWEIGSIADSAQVQRADGSRTTAHSLSLASSARFEGVDILTWPSFASVWPPPADTVRSKAALDIAFGFNLFNLQSGLLSLQLHTSATAHAKNSDEDDEVEQHIFAANTGDDWFYFEDSTSYSDLSHATGKQAPLHIGTVSGSETEMLRLRYNTRPSHKVLHKGACSFTGIKIDTDAAAARSGVTVQVNFGEDL